MAPQDIKGMNRPQFPRHLIDLKRDQYRAHLFQSARPTSV